MHLREVIRRNAADNVYLHKDFHGALSTGLAYLEQRYGAVLVEFFGSTETCVIASRRTARAGSRIALARSLATPSSATRLAPRIASILSSSPPSRSAWTRARACSCSAWASPSCGSCSTCSPPV